MWNANLPRFCVVLGCSWLTKNWLSENDTWNREIVLYLITEFQRCLTRKPLHSLNSQWVVGWFYIHLFACSICWMKSSSTYTHTQTLTQFIIQNTVVANCNNNNNNNRFFFIYNGIFLNAINLIKFSCYKMFGWCIVTAIVSWCCCCCFVCNTSNQHSWKFISFHFF